jgi:hypothetical protein
VGLEEMSPYFVKQKQQSLALASQQQQRQNKKKTQQIMDQIDLSAGGGAGLTNAGIMVQNNMYSRNRGGIHDAKTSYS